MKNHNESGRGRYENHFSHPFLGTYEVIQFFELVNLEGTPIPNLSQGVWGTFFKI